MCIYIYIYSYTYVHISIYVHARVAQGGVEAPSSSGAMTWRLRPWLGAESAIEEEALLRSFSGFTRDSVYLPRRSIYLSNDAV